MKALQNILMLFWFFWFALAGILFTAITSFFANKIIILEQVLTTGASLGILIGGCITLTLHYLNDHKKEQQQ